MSRFEIDIKTGEMIELPDITPPSRTNAEKITEEVALLNSVLQSNLTSLESQYIKALLADGASEVNKVAAIRAQQTALKTQYNLDYMAILTKYQ